MDYQKIIVTEDSLRLIRDMKSECMLSIVRNAIRQTTELLFADKCYREDGTYFSIRTFIIEIYDPISYDKFLLIRKLVKYNSIVFEAVGESNRRGLTTICQREIKNRLYIEGFTTGYETIVLTFEADELSMLNNRKFERKSKN